MPGRWRNHRPGIGERYCTLGKSELPFGTVDKYLLKTLFVLMGMMLGKGQQVC